MKLILIVLITVFLYSCSLFQTAKDIVDDNIEITWKKDKDKKQVIVDSIIIKFEPVYWVEFGKNDTLKTDLEVEYIKDGYRVWTLITPFKRYNEVKKLDTVIYLYRNKNE